MEIKKVFGVQLLPEDVPGAFLRDPTLENNSVTELKRWLECRGLNQHGKKKELIQRVRHCPKDQKIDNGVDGGKWHQAKLANIKRDKAQAARSFEVLGCWGPFPSVDIPQFFNSGHIFHYLVESCPIPLPPMDESEGEEEEQVPRAEKAFKRGKRYLDSGYVQDVFDSASSINVQYKAVVFASMRKKCYAVTITLSKRSGAITDGSCCCPQSSLARCSHVSALLQFILEYCSKNGHEAKTSTSLPRTWGLGKKEKNPGMVAMTIRDPRPSCFQNNNPHDDASELLYGLQLLNEGTVFENTLQYKYTDFKLSSEEEAVVVAQAATLIANLRPSQYVMKDPILIAGTRGQSESAAWIAHRRTIFTASEAKAVYVLKPGSWQNYLLNKLWATTEPVKTKPMVYGLKSEDPALRCYASYLETLYNDVMVTKTGLWVCSNYPMVGCSPDGIVTYLEGGKGQCGLVEVKCPWILRGKDPHKFEEILTEKQLKTFCLIRVDGVYILKRDHQFHYQVQVQLGVHKLEWCHFVVWASGGIIVIKVDFDKTFYEGVRDKLVKYHRTYLAPEYFLMRTPRRLTPLPIEW